MPESQANLIFKLSDMPHLACMECGKKLKLDHIEPASHRFDLRTYCCMACEVQETFVIEIDEKTVSPLPT